MEPSRRDWQDYEAELQQLDPETIEAEKLRTDRVRNRLKLLSTQEKNDLEELMKLAAFRRYCFTILTKAGMGLATRHAHDRDYAYDAGRRALGLELQDAWHRVRPGFAIDLAVEQAKLEEAVNAADPE